MATARWEFQLRLVYVAHKYVRKLTVPVLPRATTISTKSNGPNALSPIEDREKLGITE